MENNYDVLIIGAGISGIGAACHLKRNSPGKSFAILERREAIGGTWDLFRYPGIRSDSDMYSFGYSFRPWIKPNILADGPSIKRYVTDTAREYGVDQTINFSRKVTGASWSSTEKKWTITAENEKNGEQEKWHAKYLMICTGYYSYDKGYRPQFPGEENFKGQIIHPQHWPEDLDYSGKKVTIIGSGATAITLLPSMAKTAAHVTMLQRTPTYILSIPSMDSVSDALSKILPSDVVYNMARWRNILLQRGLYWFCREFPDLARDLILSRVKAAVGNSVDMKHFDPPYKPWDQRVCVVPNGDLFKVLKNGDGSIVTDEIETFTEQGIKVKSGEEIESDIIITATGLNVQLFGGAAIEVDGRKINISDHAAYKSVLLEDIPNMAILFGYTNASWTLKVDIACEYICRLLNHMDKKGYDVVIPHAGENVKAEDTVMGGLKSGYIARAKDSLPRQGTKDPWRVLNDYLFDGPALKSASFSDGVLQFK